MIIDRKVNLDLRFNEASHDDISEEDLTSKNQIGAGDLAFEVMFMSVLIGVNEPRIV